MNPRNLLPGRCLALALLFAALGPAIAQPAYVNYQGRLTDAAGQPLATGPYVIEFNIYNDPAGTAPTNRVWGPFIFDGAAAPGHGPTVQVVEGRFNVILGPDDTAARSIRDAFDGNDRYLEIAVGGGAPILPRQQFLSTPYAFKAQGITGSLQISGNLSVAGQIDGPVKSVVNGVEFYMVPRGSILMWSGPATGLPDGWALCDGSNGTPDLRDRFVLGYNPGVPDNGIGQTGGTESHTHVVDIAPFDTANTSGNLGYVAIGRDDNVSGNHHHAVNPPATTSSSASHLPPFIRLGFIIKL